MRELNTTLNRVSLTNVQDEWLCAGKVEVRPSVDVGLRALQPGVVVPRAIEKRNSTRRNRDQGNQIRGSFEF
jgi:hypothetical protein